MFKQLSKEMSPSHVTFVPTLKLLNRWVNNQAIITYLKYQDVIIITVFTLWLIFNRNKLLTYQRGQSRLLEDIYNLEAEQLNLTNIKLEAHCFKRNI